MTRDLLFLSVVEAPDQVRGGRYYLVCAAFFEQRLIDHLETFRGKANVTVTNRSNDWAALSLNGPKARDILAQCTQAPLDNASFRWLSAQDIEISGVRLWAFRMSYAGELGWEFHIPRDGALAVYDALMAAGAPMGLTDYGSFAMNALRMEKGFKGASELTNEVTLAEADALRFAREDKDYIGKHATLQPAKRWICAYLEIEPDGDIDGHGSEAVIWNGAVVGSTTSVAFGPTVGKILAFAYLKPEAAHPGTVLDVVIHGKPRAARVLNAPAYDPDSLRPRGVKAMEAAQ